MCYPFFLCGAFHHQEEDDKFWYSPVSYTPRKSRKKDSKNPYSTLGLDQFSALLVEHEEKRQQIYSQMGSQCIVRFVYKNSNDCVPVVVKLKAKKEGKNEPGNRKDRQPERYISEVIYKLPIPSESDKKIEKKKSFSWNVKLQNLRRPFYYIPAVIVLILLFLVFVGRSVAILCICIGWYIFPIISEEGSTLRTSMKKKDYVRKLSGNRLIASISKMVNWTATPFAFTGIRRIIFHHNVKHLAHFPTSGDSIPMACLETVGMQLQLHLGSLSFLLNLAAKSTAL
ncbi:hypothetical protein CRYUN_Cryun09bG0214900 [Craigia yunnanensis]